MGGPQLEMPQVGTGSQTAEINTRRGVAFPNLEGHQVCQAVAVTQTLLSYPVFRPPAHSLLAAGSRTCQGDATPMKSNPGQLWQCHQLPQPGSCLKLLLIQTREVCRQDPCAGEFGDI